MKRLIALSILVALVAAFVVVPSPAFAWSGHNNGNRGGRYHNGWSAFGGAVVGTIVGNALFGSPYYGYASSYPYSGYQPYLYTPPAAYYAPGPVVVQQPVVMQTPPAIVQMPLPADVVYPHGRQHWDGTQWVWIPNQVQAVAPPQPQVMVAPAPSASLHFPPGVSGACPYGWRLENDYQFMADGRGNMNYTYAGFWCHPPGR